MATLCMNLEKVPDDELICHIKYSALSKLQAKLMADQRCIALLLTEV